VGLVLLDLGESLLCLLVHGDEVVVVLVLFELLSALLRHEVVLAGYVGG
jgi:hypothetical protein